MLVSRIHIELLRSTGLSGIICIQPRRYRDRPYVGVAAKPTQTVQTLELQLRLLGRAWKMRRDHPIAAELERAMIGSQVLFVVGTVAVLVIAVITDRHNRSPFLCFFEDDEKVILRVAR